MSAIGSTRDMDHPVTCRLVVLSMFRPEGDTSCSFVGFQIAARPMLVSRESSLFFRFGLLQRSYFDGKAVATATTFGDALLAISRFSADEVGSSQLRLPLATLQRK